jgi:hypothetical protein
MNEPTPIFTVSKDSKCLKTFADYPGQGDYCFEVKDGDRILYHGDSFEKARQTYESPAPEASH